MKCECGKEATIFIAWRNIWICEECNTRRMKSNFGCLCR